MHYPDDTGTHVWDGTAGILNERGTKIGHITDGSRNTILLFEMAGKPHHWKLGMQQGSPTNAQYYAHGPWAGNNGVGIYNWNVDGTGKGCDDCWFFINVDNEVSPYSFHTGVVNIMLADGSTRSLSENVDSKLFADLCRATDGNVIGEY